MAGAALGRGRTLRAGALLVVLALGAAACGSRVDPAAQPAAVGVAAPTTIIGGVDGPGGDGARFGDQPSPCGPGDGGGATDIGLTEDTITLGVITDRKSTFVPGINEGFWFGTLAWATWCNAQGGIDGRQVELIEYNADIFRYRDAILQACEEVFALVGGGGIQDNLGAQDAVDCGLAEVAGATINAKKTEADRVYEPLPNPAGTFPVGAGAYYLEQFPEIADKAVYLNTDVPIGHYQRDRHVQAYESIGYTFQPAPRTAQLNEDNWRSIVLELERDGIEYLSLTSSVEEGRNLFKAMADQGWMPTVFDLEANFYTERLLESAGEDADGIFVRITVWPFEEAERNPATAQFVSLLRDEVGAAPSLLGVHAFSAGLLFATAVGAVEGDLTRDALLAELDDIHEWNGLGLHSPTDPGAPEPSSCFIIMRVRDGAYERFFPAGPDDEQDGYACDASMRAELDVTKLTNYEPGATAG